MPFLLILFASALAGAYLLGQKFGYKWVVDLVKSTYEDDHLRATLDPLMEDGNYIGFDLRLNNRSDREIVVNWNDCQYWQDGSTNGKLVFSGRPLQPQIGVECTPDTIFEHALMRRALVPIAHLTEREIPSTYLGSDQIVEEEDDTPPPMYSILDTEEGGDGIIRLKGGTGRSPPRGSPAPRKKIRRRVRTVPHIGVANDRKEMVAGALPEGAHGIVLSLLRDGELHKIALSFDLKKEKKGEKREPTLEEIAKNVEYIRQRNAINEAVRESGIQTDPVETPPKNGLRFIETPENLDPKETP